MMHEVTPCLICFSIIFITYQLDKTKDLPDEMNFGYMYEQTSPNL
jgi:hypothetical protein